MKRQLIAIGIAAVLALLGIVVLINYAKHADDRAFEGTELVSVVRAKTDVPAGTTADDLAKDVEVAKVPKTAAIPGALASLSSAGGMVTTTALVAGDQLTAAKLGKPGTAKGANALPKGMQELTIPIAGARLVGGAVKPGDKVGFFASYQDVKTTSNPINDLLVLKVDAGVAGSDGSGGTDVTVAVKTLTAEKIIHALEFGKPWMTKQNPDTDTGGGKSITTKDVAP